MDDATARPDGPLTVYYDGACPLCRREIGLYRGLPSERALCFVDVADTAQALPVERERLLARFHVAHPDGRLDSGARAFLALWAALPGWRWLARLGAVPGVAAMLEALYRLFLRVRPTLQRLARARDRAPTDGAGTLPPGLAGDLRSDHAGETGAVQIYRGVLAVADDPALRAFAERHLATEQGHLDLVSQWLPRAQRSHALGAWRVAGWLTGALPALAGPRAVYATIVAVETFVDRHYQEQIDRLAGAPEHAALRAALLACQADEHHHRGEAAALRGTAPPGPLLRGWCALVGAGSAAAVALARRF